MLVTCPECDLKISDKAISCPHCGYPVSSQKRSRPPSKRMKLPNGFGQITELKGRNMRKPFRAMVCVGKNEYGRPISKLLKPQAYFETYNQAYEALVEYNKNPYDFDILMTVEELYNMWSKEYFEKITDSSIRTVTSAWAYCDSVKTIPARDIRVRHIKSCMESCKSQNISNRVKSIFNLMLDYALEREIVDKNYARDFKTERAEVVKKHESFTKDELDILWKYNSNPQMAYLLLACYTGWRPQELCLINLSDIDLDKKTMFGGMKTNAGKNRTVPVCETIYPVLVDLYKRAENCGGTRLMCDSDGSSISYDAYYKRFKVVAEEYNISHHRPHDARKTFISMCKNVGMDEYAIKKIVGHSIDDITEKIYTDRKKDWLQSEIVKLDEKKEQCL